MSAIEAQFRIVHVDLDFADPDEGEAHALGARIEAAIPAAGFRLFRHPTGSLNARSFVGKLANRRGYGASFILLFEASHFVINEEAPIRIEIAHRLADIADAAGRRLAPFKLLDDVSGQEYRRERWGFGDPETHAAFVALVARLLGHVSTEHRSVRIRPGLRALMLETGIGR